MPKIALFALITALLALHQLQLRVLHVSKVSTYQLQQLDPAYLVLLFLSAQLVLIAHIV